MNDTMWTRFNTFCFVVDETPDGKLKLFEASEQKIKDLLVSELNCTVVLCAHLEVKYKLS